MKKIILLRTLALLLLLLACCLLALLLRKPSWEAILSYGLLSLALTGGNVVYWFSRKGSSARRILQISLWFIIAYYLVCLLRGRSSGLGFPYCTLIGTPLLAAFAFCICRRYSRWLALRQITAALLAPCFLFEWFFRIFYWEETLVSLPSTFFLLLGIVTGILLYCRRHWPVYALAVVGMGAAVFMFHPGYKMWINKLNYGTFTGRVERKAMPDYRFLNEQGDTVRLSHYRGRKVLVDCWTKRCGVCFKKMPLLQQLHKRYETADNVYVTSLFVAYRSDKPEEGAQIVREEGYTFPVWGIDKVHPLLDDLKINTYPKVLLFDEEGALIFYGSLEDAEVLLNE